MIVVVGSINADLVFEVDEIPRGGETVVAKSHRVVAGGKGANQAVAAARLGADVTFIGCVGDDQPGTDLRRDLEAEGVDAVSMSVASGPTGTAVVAVDKRGENAIIVDEGANGQLALGEEQTQIIQSAEVVLCQQEIPINLVADVAALTKGVFVLNAAPSKGHPDGLLERVDVLVVNEHEAKDLGAGRDPVSIRALGVPTVITTLGAAGARVVTGGDIAVVEPPTVSVRDTTGAGDTFCGALVAAMHDGMDVFEATARGVIAGALATQRLGARTAMPTAAELDEALVRRQSSRPTTTH
ncbi:MAG: ribokinase [Acidimicrobiia bacterium]